MNKVELESLLESCRSHLQSRTPEQILKMQEKFDGLPSDACFSFPEGFDPILPSGNDFLKNYFISVGTEYKFDVDKISISYLNGVNYDVNMSNYIIESVIGQVPNFMDSAA